MLPARHRITDLPPEITEEVLRLLAEDTRDSRLRALQLLTSAYEQDEERRRRAAGEARPEAPSEDGDGDGLEDLSDG